MMKRSTLTAVALAGMIALPGAALAGGKDDMTFSEKVEKNWSQFREFTIEQKDAAVENGRDLVATIDARIDELSADASEATDDARVAMQDEIAELKEVRARIAKSLDDAGEATASGWDRFKNAVGNAYEEVRETFVEDQPKSE